MTGYSTGVSTPPLMIAWPDAELNRADGFAMVRDANAFDDIVEPGETRQMLIKLLRALPVSQQPPRSRKPRPVDSW